MTMTIPNTLTGDTYLSGAKVAGNFDYIKSYLNGGIAATDLSASAGIHPLQVAENRSIDSVVLHFSATGQLDFPVISPIEICEISVTTTVTGVNDASVTARVINRLDDKVVAKAIRSPPLSASYSSGYVSFYPRITLQKGFHTVSVVFANSSVTTHASVRIGFVQKHTKV